MSSYVYLLLEPETKRPFFAGTHTSSSAARSGLQLSKDHFSELLNSPEADLTDLQQSNIAKLSAQNGVDQAPEDLYRVIARDLRSPAHAELVRNALIISWAEPGALGREPANDPVQFRPYQHLKGDRGRIEGFDPKEAANGNVASVAGSHPHGKYFVYALLDPADGKVFYVGKGRGNRIANHFNQAKNLARVTDQTRRKKKLERLKALLDQGHRPIDATMILARVDDEDEAFLLETFYLKFVFGPWSLENSTGGRDSDLFRAHGDLQHRYGFEIPAERKGADGRRIKEDLFKGAGFDRLLEQASKALNRRITAEGHPPVTFSTPGITGAGELSVNTPLVTPLGQIKLMLHIRSAQTGRLNCSTHPHGRRGSDISRIIWQEVCRLHELGTPQEIGYRRDNHFNPRVWQGEHLAPDIDTLVDRAFFLYRVLMTPLDQQDGLRKEAQARLLTADAALD
ncbi:hypothetical protein A6K26_006360 [Gammaproteobacteria bacterium 2W06]|nr:hypothetical protein A6K26_006360 [Gammaproteobacteria bacterium 2W06]